MTDRPADPGAASGGDPGGDGAAAGGAGATGAAAGGTEAGTEAGAGAGAWAGGDGADPALPWREIRGEGFNAHIGPVLFAPAGDRRWLATLELRAIHMNAGGVCHGGVLMALADIVMGTASYVAGGDYPCATIAFDAQFLAAARGGQRLVAEARQLRRVRDLSFMEARIEAGGRLVMRASGLWKHLASRAPGTDGSPPAAG